MFCFKNWMRRLARALLICLVVSLLACSHYRNYDVTDHYNGSKFFNPDGPKAQSIWQILGLIFTLKLDTWPESVEIRPSLKLEKPLSKTELAITFVGHSTVLLQFPGLNILTDPVWVERIGPGGRWGPKRVRKPGIELDALPKIDVILLSHNHYDHMYLESVKVISDRFTPLVLVPLGDQSLLESAGIRNVTEVDWWQSLTTPARAGELLKITFTPAQHNSGRGLFDEDKSLWGNFMLTRAGKTIYFGGDSAYSKNYLEIKRRLGAPDLALLPIGAYEPQVSMKCVHMNPEEAVRAHQDLAAKRSIGIHIGTFQQTEEPIDQPLRDLKKAKSAYGIRDDQFFTLDEGVTTFIEL